jgi:hypothetical protein
VTAVTGDWVFNGLERMKTPAGLGVLASALSTGGLLHPRRWLRERIDLVRGGRDDHEG